MFSASTGAALSLDRALHDDSSFELGEGSNDRKHGAAHGSARVKALAVAHEIDAQGVELVEGGDEMPNAAREPVEAIDEHDVAGALSRGVHELVEGRAPLSSTAGAVVNELAHDFEIATPSEFAKNVELHRWTLPGQCRNPSVDRGTLQDLLFGHRWPRLEHERLNRWKPYPPRQGPSGRAFGR